MAQTPDAAETEASPHWPQFPHMLSKRGIPVVPKALPICSLSPECADLSEGRGWKSWRGFSVTECGHMGGAPPEFRAAVSLCTCILSPMSQLTPRSLWASSRPP